MALAMWVVNTKLRQCVDEDALNSVVVVAQCINFRRMSTLYLLAELTFCHSVAEIRKLRSTVNGIGPEIILQDVWR